MGRAAELKEREWLTSFRFLIMAQVTYRGAKYDSDEYRNRPCQVHKVNEIYRGIKHTEEHKVREVVK